MEAKLTVVGGKANKAAVALRLPTTIGRSREAGITVAHPMISRRHCELSESNGLILLRDLGSLNGTLVAGQKVQEAVLKPQDEFTVGPLTFRVEYKYGGDLSDVPPPTLAEETAESAEAELEVPDFASAEAEEAVEAVAEPAADEVAEDEAPVFADVDAPPLVPEEEGPAAALPAAIPAEEATAGEVEEEVEERDAFDEAIQEVTTTETDQPGAQPAAPAEPASAEPVPELVLRPEPEPQPTAEEEPGPVDLDAIEEVPDLSFMDEEGSGAGGLKPDRAAAAPAEELTVQVDEFPVEEGEIPVAAEAAQPPEAVVEEDELAAAVVEHDEFVEVEVVDEEEPEPSPPPGPSAPEPPPAAAPPEPPEAPSPPHAPAAGEPDFSALTETDDEPEPGEASDAALNDFLKGLK